MAGGNHIRVLFASDYPHLPENTGGVEVNTHELCLALKAAGHQVAILTALSGRGMVGTLARVKLRARLVRNFATDRGLGYPVMRCWQPATALSAAIARFHPDVVVVQSWRFGMVEQALRHGAAAMLYTHSANSIIEGVTNRGLLAHCLLVANSAFNAEFQGSTIKAPFAVLPPLVNPSRYLCDGPRKHVVQVGLSREKGAQVTFAIARQRPDIQFLVVQNWEGLQRTDRTALQTEAAALANLHIVPPERDARDLYRRARLLLAPSQGLETWGRVVNEAQLNGIPVVASNRGGLPEAVGSGGVILDWQSPPDLWAAAVSRLWDEPDWYAEMARRGRARMTEDDVRPNVLCNRFVALLEAALDRRRRVAGLLTVP